MSTLLLRVEPHLGEPFYHRVEGDSLVLGRSSKADLVVTDRYMSRLQAKFFREEAGWFVADLGSRNPTLLNGRAVTEPRRIAPGDAISISETRVYVEFPGAEEQPEREDSSDATLFRPASALVERSTDGSTDQAMGAEGLKRQADRLRMLNVVHRALASPISLQDLLDLILDRAFADLRPEEGVIFLKRPDGEFYRAATRRVPGLSGDFLYSRSLMREVTEKGLAALVFDASADERFAAAESIMSSGVRSLVAAPLYDPDGCPGMIALNSRAHVRRFSEDDMELLVSLASVAALRIRNIALAEEAAQRRVLEKELSLARRIQVGLLPEKLPELPGFELQAFNIPSRAVSGDFYQAQTRFDDRECVLMVADVSGKGMSASLLTASLEALSAGPIEVGHPPEEICARLSRRLYVRTPPERYATAFVAALEPATGKLSYTNAGHNPALLLRRDGGCEKLSATGLPLGLLPTANYSSEQRTLGPGDCLVVYTDGVTEAANPAEDEYGVERLEETLLEHMGESVPALILAIEKDLMEFAHGVPFGDDQTLLVLRRRA